MPRGRVIFWSISGAIIASGLGAYVWSERQPKPQALPPLITPEAQRAAMFAKADKPPEPWPVAADAWWKRTTLDAYDRATAANPWPGGRRAVVAFAKDFSDDPTATGDEAEDAAAAAETAANFTCDDPLIHYIRGQYLARLKDRAAGSVRDARRESIQSLIKAADAFPASTYPAVRKSLGLFYVAAAVGEAEPYLYRGMKPDPKRYAEAAMALVQEVLADPGLPPGEAYRLLRYAGRASVAVHNDRTVLGDKVLAALEASPQPRSVVLTARGEYMKDLAWDARGSGVAGTVTRSGWQGFAARLADARAAFEQAWALDQRNAFAATEMITVCMGEGGERAEMERWYERAMAADPANVDACGRKLYYLEPKWHGSPADMIGFARELAAAAAARPDDIGAARAAVAAVDAHWKLGRYVAGGGRSADYPAPDYFAKQPGAWDDVRRAYEAYLKHVPASRYHRTRYAVIAAWAGHADVAKAQFDRLGNAYSRHVIPDAALAPLRAGEKVKPPERLAPGDEPRVEDGSL